jgi:DNA-binding FrmR family transcriptional regulator
MGYGMLILSVAHGKSLGKEQIMDKTTQQEVVRRLRSAEGHIRGIMRMIEEERPCMAVIQQIQAVQGSLKRAQMLLIRCHLDVCLCDLDGQDMERTLSLREELVALFDQKN